jgi:hypothetical protein
VPPLTRRRRRLASFNAAAGAATMLGDPVTSLGPRLDLPPSPGVEDAPDGRETPRSTGTWETRRKPPGRHMTGSLRALRAGETPSVVLPDPAAIDRLGQGELDDLLDDLAATTLYTQRRRRTVVPPAASAEADAASLEEIREILPNAKRRWLVEKGIAYPEKVAGAFVYSRARAVAYRAGRPLPPFPGAS